MNQPAPPSRVGQHLGIFTMEDGRQYGADQKLPEKLHVARLDCSCGSRWVANHDSPISAEESQRGFKATLGSHQNSALPEN